MYILYFSLHRLLYIGGMDGTLQPPVKRKTLDSLTVDGGIPPTVLLNLDSERFPTCHNTVISAGGSECTKKTDRLLVLKSKTTSRLIDGFIFCLFSAELAEF